MRIIINLRPDNYKLYDEYGVLARQRLTALLPVGSAPLIDHLLGSVTLLNPSSVLILCAAKSQELLSIVGNGSRYGLENLHIKTNGAGADFSENRHSTENQANSEPASPADNTTLLIDGNRFFDFSLPDMINELLGEYGSTDCHLQEINSGIRLRIGNAENYMGVEYVDKPVARKTRLANSPQRYHQLAMLSAGRELKNIRHHGRRHQRNLMMGRVSSVPVQANLTTANGGVVAGRFVDVHKSCKLHGNVVLGDKVVVDRGTEIHNSVIMSNTYIGENLTIRDSIIDGKHVYRVDTGAYLQIQDSFICCSFEEQNITLRAA